MYILLTCTILLWFDNNIGGVINTLDNLTDDIRDEYEDFLTQVDEITYYQLCQVSIVLSVSHAGAQTELVFTNYVF